ncbi:ArnT family glycosyltransferase [Paludisphaera mucosa]|uniref:Glycosyltransferase family 39 protein n=1 Tax=Paludisphaera mucosa TaxID=3030827 RepID=A0ABT6FJF4_9BACT|nr:glycosyltransferase family 39 protein [Paludisphaera mucosa]MDG3007631.1 glycosyltransferase family 39 protein [Paludisphaera mucosa]
MTTNPQPGRRPAAWLLLVGPCLVALGPGLGSGSRLSYHEAFVAQGGREMLESGDWSQPTIGGRPWLEKPPLPFWMAAAAGAVAGRVSPLAARLPSALAATGLALGVAFVARRRFGGTVSLLAGAVQATTAWAVLRGRLAEADVTLACLFVWTMAAFDRIRETDDADGDESDPRRRAAWRWAFFALLGTTSLAKGIGFGAALIAAAAGGTLAWDRRPGSWRRFAFPAGWLVAAALALAWPLAMLRQHGAGAASLWLMHVADRFGPRTGHGVFAGETPGAYAVDLLSQGLPWTPFAILGAWRSLRRRSAGDRLLAAWAILPLVLVSIPGGRNGHYAIYAMIPWSIWAAISLEALGDRLVLMGRRPARVRRLAFATFAGLAAAYGLGFGLVAPMLERRGAEPDFYERIAPMIRPDEPLVLLYDDWDRDPYPTPFGPIPHDLAVRLYYLGRPATWVVGEPSGATPATPSIAVLGRDRDLPALAEAGDVEPLARGPSARWDRTFRLFRLRPNRPESAVAAYTTSFQTSRTK